MILIMLACGTPDDALGDELVAGDPPEVRGPALRAFQCDLWTCEQELVVGMPQLERCYRWHDRQGWMGDPPAEVEQHCMPGALTCVIPVRTGGKEGWDATTCPTHCAEGDEGGDPPAGCCLDGPDLEAAVLDQWAADAAGLVVRIEADCDDEVHVVVECDQVVAGTGLTFPCPE